MATKYYRGRRDDHGTGSVTVVDEGVERPLDPRLDLVNHSPTGLEWGYHGSGPAQLALAMLADATGDDAKALQYYQQFKRGFVALLTDGWTDSVGRVLAVLEILEEGWLQA